MLPINFDTTLAKKLDLGMRSGDVIDLPFPVIYIWALNGQTNLRSQGGAMYYGGWACKAEDTQMIAEQQGLTIPKEWKQVTIASRDGGEFEAYTTRSVYVAPVGKRVSWLVDGKRSADYVEGARRHVQVLAYLSETKTENGSRQFIPWGPIVLTAKGYQARNLLDAFSHWHRATTQIRWRVAPGLPAWCFYLALGTFGKERQAVNVGKPGAQSPITPVKAYIPERFTEEMITNLYVGNEIAAVMADLQDQATDWLNAWKQNIVVEPEEYAENGASHEGEEEIPF